MEKNIIISLLLCAALSAGGRPAAAAGIGSVADAAGDSRPILAEQAKLGVFDADLVSAWVRPAADYPATELGVELASPLVQDPGHNFNLFFFFDTDRVAENNDQSGTRAGADTAYSLMYADLARTWRTFVWQYDAEIGQWSFVESPDVLFALLGMTVIMHVPFERLPADACRPWRAAVGASDNTGTSTEGDMAPDGEGNLVDICGDEPRVVSGLVVAQPEKEAAPEAAPPGNEGAASWWKWLVMLMFLGGGALVAGKLAGGQKSDDQPKGDTSPKTPKKPDREEKTCCRTCSMFVSVGSKDNPAIRSAANLGLGIRRDTEKAAPEVIPADDRCLKVAHFFFDTFEKGHRLSSDGHGEELDIVDFNRRADFLADEGLEQVDLWKEVMIVSHGEKGARIKNILVNFHLLIPAAPVLKLVLYYCGGERTLPEAEFRELAAELGRRLKTIPEECEKFRANEVQIYLAPTVSFCGSESRYTRLMLEADGLKSFEAKMTLFTVDAEGRVTAHGNVTPPGGQLFGRTSLGRLAQNDVFDAAVYWDFWTEDGVCCLKLSEIKARRALIERNDKALAAELAKYGRKYGPPRKCQKEVRAEDLGREVAKLRLAPLTEAEMDGAMEQTSTKELQKYMRSIRG